MITRIATAWCVMFIYATPVFADFHWQEPEIMLCEIDEKSDPLNAKETDFNMQSAMQIFESNGLYQDNEGVPHTIVELTLIKMHALATLGELNRAKMNNDTKKIGIYQRYYNTYRSNFCNKLKNIIWPS